MRFFLILLVYLNCFANTTGNNLKKPNSSAFDITYQSPQNKIQESLHDMILIEIAKETFLTRRNNNIFSCGSDPFGNSYCPSNLAKADSYWDYDNGFSVKNNNIVSDYTGQIMETEYENPTTKFVCSIGKYDPATGKCIYGGLYQIAFNNQPDLEGYNHWKNTFSNPPSYENIRTFIRAGASAYEKQGVKNPYICGYDVVKDTKTNPWTIDEKALNIVAAYIWYLGRCPEPEGYNNHYAFNNWSIGWFIKAAETSGECPNRGACPYTPPLVKTAPANKVNECSTGYNYNSKENVCERSVAKCPSGYNKTTGAEASKGVCVKSIEYTYYNYLCNNSKNEQGYNYTPVNSGGNCNKVDPNNTTNNSSTLDDACNSATPPTNNCKRLGYRCNSNERKPAFVDGEWKCSPFLCDSNMKCGYGTCDLPTKPSLDKYMDVAYNPLQYISSNKCNGAICDYVINKEVSYCENKQCPKSDDIIEKDGKCYKLECPKDTYISGDKCIKANY